jgi:hypothetical protein
MNVGPFLRFPRQSSESSTQTTGAGSGSIPREANIARSAEESNVDQRETTMSGDSMAAPVNDCHSRRESALVHSPAEAVV